ncbi:MAG TPA: hypothetical protein VKE74_10690 [Gemmataceae bacterium]|nr:hypothetical protein [Gemmataceae bacterium]
METPPPTPPPNGAYSAPTRGFAVASVALGYFSLIVFFWKPFALILGLVGLALGVASWAAGNRGSLRGEPNMAVIGTLVCAFSLGITVTLYKALGQVQWDYPTLSSLGF